MPSIQTTIANDNHTNPSQQSIQAAGKSRLKPFNREDFADKVAQGFCTGFVSTLFTFSLCDKPLMLATKMMADGTQARPGKKWVSQQVMAGNFANLWENSLYRKAYRAYWKHPIKGLPMAMLNSCSKNVTFFPLKYLYENLLNEHPVSSFAAGATNTIISSPISFAKTNQMANRENFDMKRSLSGTPAIALRDGVQFFVLFNTITILKANFGDNPIYAGFAGILGYCFSNPLSIIGLNQKVSNTSTSLLEMGTKIYKTGGMKAFYPMTSLAVLGMFGRGLAIGEISNLYDAMKSARDELTPTL